MSKKVHINAIMHEIDEYLSLRIIESKISDKDKLFGKAETFNNIKYVFKLIDIAKPKEIRLLFDFKLDDYLFRIKANTIEQFKKDEIERLQNYKMYFSDNVTNSKYKEYYNILSKLIDYLTKMDLDIRYLVQSYDSDISNSIDFNLLKKYIKEKGFFIINTNLKPAKIFTAELAFVLCNSNLQIHNLNTDTVKYINGTYFWTTYIDAFSRGEQHFNDEYKASPEILYGSRSESYIKNLHHKYFHDLSLKPYEGWKFVKNYYPELITHKQIDLFGFYSGVINSLEEIIKTHPKIFQSFDKCEHEVDNQSLIYKMEQKNEAKITINEKALVYILDLFAINKDVPYNPVEGSYSKKILISLGVELYGFKPENDSFYRSVIKIRGRYDLNKKRDLDNISKRWYDVTKKLSKNWVETEKYLIEKNLIGD